MARLAFGAKLGSLNCSGVMAFGVLEVIVAWATELSAWSPVRDAIAAQPITLPARPRKCRRVCSAAHSCFSSSGIGNARASRSCSVSVQSGCCFIMLLSLLGYGLVQVHHLAGHHRPGRQLRSRNGRIASLFSHADQLARRLWISLIVL